MKLSDFAEILYATSCASDGNMSFAKGKVEEILANREKFLKKLGVNWDQITSVKQVHSNIVVHVARDNPPQENIEADGLVTKQRGIYLMLKTADCLPISFYDPKKGAIAIIHAGWPGIGKGIIEKAVKMMAKEFATKPENLIAEIGPSLGPCCNTKHPDIEQKDDPKWQPFVKKDSSGYTVDLWAFAENELKSQRILAENINNPKICTYHSGKYFSYRKTKDLGLPDENRFATIIGIKP